MLKPVVLGKKYSVANLFSELKTIDRTNKPQAFEKLMRHAFLHAACANGVRGDIHRFEQQVSTEPAMHVQRHVFKLECWCLAR